MTPTSFPLLHKQERRLIGDELHRRAGGRAGVFAQFAIAFLGDAPISSEPLARAVNAAIARHGALRTVVVPTARYDDGVRQVLLQRFATTGLFSSGLYEQRLLDPADVSVRELQCRDGEEQAAIAREECGRPLNMEHGPVVRLARIEGGGQHLALINLSHLMLDLWATRLVHSEIARAYTAFMANEAWAPTGKPLQQHELVCEELAMLQGPDGEQHKEFWACHYSGLGDAPIRVSEVPFAISSSEAPEFATLRVELPDNLLRQFSIAFGGLPDYAFWRTIYGIALGVLVNKSRVALWANFFNRRRPGAQTAVAWCVHSHLLAVDARWARPWAEVWCEVRSGIRQAQAHEQYSVDTLGQCLGRVVDGQDTRLSFDVVPDHRRYDNAQLHPIAVPGVSRPADLDVRVHVPGNAYRLVATFNARRYNPDGVRHLLSLFDATIRACLAAPSAKVGDIVRSVRQVHRVPKALVS